MRSLETPHPGCRRVIVGRRCPVPCGPQGRLQLARRLSAALPVRWSSASVKRWNGGRIPAPGLSVRVCRAFRCRSDHGAVLVFVRRHQDKGVIGPKLQFRRFAEMSQVQRRRPNRTNGPCCLSSRRTAATTSTATPASANCRKVIHRRVDGNPLVGVFARRRDSLDIVEHQQVGTEGVGRSGDVFQVERRPDEGEPVGERFQGVHRLVEPVGVFGGEAAVANRPQVDPREPR